MANLVEGKLPPPEGMTYEEFLEYSMYLALREFIRAYNGPAEAKKFDESYREGRRIDQVTVARHPLGQLISGLGTALHGGAVMPGWDNAKGTMNWNAFATFVRWYASLPDKQKAVALRRVREGSETPWKATAQELAAAQAARQKAEQALQQPGLVRGPNNDALLEKEEEKPGFSTMSWVLIAALVVGAGYLIYRTFNKATAAAENPSQKDDASSVKALPAAGETEVPEEQAGEEEPEESEAS